MNSIRPKARPKNDEDGDAPPPPPPPPPALEEEKRGGFFGRFMRKNKDKESTGSSAAAAEVDLDLAERRANWEKQETDNEYSALQFGTEYTRKPMPVELRDAAYDAREADELALARVEHERAEQMRQLHLGDAYVPIPFVEPAKPKDTVEEAKRDEEDAPPPPPPPPPPAEDVGAFAEKLGAMAYGAEQMQSSSAYGTTAKAAPSALMNSVPVRLAAPAVKVGWAGIFDTRRRPAAANPFTGAIVYPQVAYRPPLMTNSMREKSIAPDLLNRLNEGRRLATLALNHHESAPKLAASGRHDEAQANYMAADAGYDGSLRVLMPLRKTLNTGQDASKPAYVREAANLEDLITKILDNWEEVKPRLIPDVPGSMPAFQGEDVHDPLIDRFSGGISQMGPPPPQDMGTMPSVYNASGELNLDAFPSIPTHDVPGVSTDENQQRTGGPRSCYVCSSETTKKTAELVTPCDHYFCLECADQMFSLFPDGCPQCGARCRKDELKAIA